MKKFIGRELELAKLNQYKNQGKGSLIVIRGRRRIGKSRLIEKFAENMNFIKVSGLPPTQQPNSQSQKDHFADAMQRLGTARPEASDWYNLFLHLTQNLPKAPTVLLLDEISWLAKGDDSFLPKLKDVWDDHFSKHPNLIMVLCGSVSSWIDKNILSSTAFFGRINETITLKELSLHESLELLDAHGFKGSSFEKLLVLNTIGGVPWYLEQFTRGKTAEAHISRLCFAKEGLFVGEFQRIFHDLFDNRAEVYTKIISQLANGAKEYKIISKLAGYGSSSTLSEYLKDLAVAGFITKDKAWSFKTGQWRNIFTYRLSDNYLRFYLRCIKPNLPRIEAEHLNKTSVTTIKGFSSIYGLQFENLILNNRKLIIKELGINPQDIVADNPYLQRGGKTKAGCQIDYMIQTVLNSLFICEIKFSQGTISSKLIHEMQAKIKALKKPKNLACLPVLIYFGEISENLLENEFFYKIINIQELLAATV